MKTRIISGAFYVAILLAFFLLRQLVSTWIFHLLTYFFIVVGTYELARATKKITIKGTRILSMVFALLFVPVYYIFQHHVAGSYGLLFATYLTAIMLIINLFLAINSNANMQKTLWTLLTYVYPAMLLLFMLASNDMIIFTFEGEEMMASAVRKVDYENQSVPVSIFYDGAAFDKGTYKVDIYIDGRHSGSQEHYFE